MFVDAGRVVNEKTAILYAGRVSFPNMVNAILLRSGCIQRLEDFCENVRLFRTI